MFGAKHDIKYSFNYQTHIYQDYQSRAEQNFLHSSSIYESFQTHTLFEKINSVCTHYSYSLSLFLTPVCFLRSASQPICWFLLFDVSLSHITTFLLYIFLFF